MRGLHRDDDAENRDDEHNHDDAIEQNLLNHIGFSFLFGRLSAHILTTAELSVHYPTSFRLFCSASFNLILVWTNFFTKAPDKGFSGVKRTVPFEVAKDFSSSSCTSTGRSGKKADRKSTRLNSSHIP